MSQENVEIVRRFFDAGQRSLEAYWKPESGAAALDAGDLDPETEAVLAFIHHDVEYGGRPSRWRVASPTVIWAGCSVGCVSGRE